MDLQVRQEAEEAFGDKEAEPSRHAAEQMLITVCSLKVCCPGQAFLKQDFLVQKGGTLSAMSYFVPALDGAPTAL